MYGRNSRRALLALLVLPIAAMAQAPQQSVEVSTPALRITFDPAGGAITSWEMIPPGSSLSQVLLDPELLARTGFRPLRVLTGTADAFAPDRRPHTIEVDRSRPEEQVVVITSPVDESGLQVTRTYRFPASGHVFTLGVELRNRSEASLELGDEDTPGPRLTLGPGIGFAPGRRPELFEETLLAPLTLAFTGRPDGIYSEATPLEPPFRADLPAVAMHLAGLQSPSTVVAVAPSPAQDADPFVGGALRLDPTPAVAELIAADDREYYPCLELAIAPTTLGPGRSTTHAYRIYAGPKDLALLAAAEPGLEHAPFSYLPGWMATLCLAMHSILEVLRGIVGSWWLAIVLFAVLFRVVTLPLSMWGAKSAIEMKAKMAAVKPLVAELKTKHKNADKRNEAILALYKEHGINPFAHFKGCLPLVIQLPVLVALFNLLLNSYDLHGEGFLWIGDLTLTDRLFPLGFTIPWLGSYFNLLPLIMCAGMLLVGRAMKQADPAHASGGAGQYAMPVAMTLLFYPFPSGAMLFWTTGTLFQVFEQQLITARFRRA